MKLSPIVLFVYNRPWHTRQTVEALKKNEFARESEIFIYSDAPKNKDAEKNVQEVRKYIKKIDGFKKVSIIERDKNWGLANNIINGVTTIINKYGKIIVLEDDLVTSPYFLRFMNESLTIYQYEKKVVSIHGYIYPIENLPETFFIKGADCWGWATWKRGWDIFEKDGQKLLDELKNRGLEKEADFDNSYGFTQMLKNQIKGKNNSWAVRWYMSAFLKNMLTLYPGVSYVQNIGLDSSGSHCGTGDTFKTKLADKICIHKVAVKEDTEAKKKIEQFFKSIKLGLFARIKLKLRRLLLR